MENTLSELLNMCMNAEKIFKKEGGKGQLLFLRRDQLLLLSLMKKLNANLRATRRRMEFCLKPKGGVEKKQEEDKEAKGPCFHYGKPGRWKRNCQTYLACLKGNKAEEAGNK
ncbi:PREDICTED: POPTR_0002s22330g partial [Prunus dulcis]|uniref:PREDICTED: POPTR_0002s22330g partial n=1 Tax=Prunus dulcis TaxID=3755 RepID=A0A5E4G6V1_PRUDU|nr:PREDICTED: POPTR_0002s22330g partial [Prunus dulcis]